jgi:Cys-tRNA(Pro)/Cys-tRNA(Cys) deacylase
MLEQRKVPHQVFQFDDAIRSAQDVVRVTGVPADQVLKTLVVENDPPRGKAYLVMVPASQEIDLRVLAACVGAKKLRMASHRDAERHTGLKVGGISALALTGRGFSVLIEETATLFDEVLVSAGERGFDVRIRVSDLVALTGAQRVRVS